MTRRCGPCSACCTALAVEEISKAECAPCPHDGGGWKACAIYDDRPSGCRKFECDWLRGHMASKDRPDKLGLVVAAQEGGLVLWEIHHDARTRSTRGRALIDKALACGITVIIVAPDGRRTRIQPRGKV